MLKYADIFINGYFSLYVTNDRMMSAGVYLNTDGSPYFELSPMHIVITPHAGLSMHLLFLTDPNKVFN